MNVTRRMFLKKAIRMAMALGLGSTFYSFGWGRLNYQIQNVTIRFPHLPPSFHGFRIVQFSDVHFGHFFGSKELQTVCQHIQYLKPDMICFTGDFVDSSVEDLYQAIPILQTMSAPHGKWGVLGNHDYYEQPTEVKKALEHSGFRVLLNEHQRIEKNGESIYMAGVDDMLGGYPRMEETLEGIPSDAFTILLAHASDYADRTKQTSISLQLSGHTHGGQIRLPYLPPLHLPIGGKKYAEGLMQVEQMKLYVNRGIGTTGLPLRFFCPPEITCLTLEKEV